MNISTSSAGLAGFNAGIDAGISGIHRASAAIDRASSQIVHKTFTEGRPETLFYDMVDLKKNLLLFEASGKVVKLANESAGRLIDIMA